ncbi:unnamed protein product [Schistocephalus solidus]|uniref:Secreted protein n=1 Tax=Schistocephalus solidus TaxID=70667 RepID=A0A183SP22_SCHSO|nr:unnamed protein product [Schistocephalus solidus]
MTATAVQVCLSPLAQKLVPSMGAVTFLSLGPVQRVPAAVAELGKQLEVGVCICGFSIRQQASGARR